ncbi:MAG: efflux RND transporter periplasmic adaptor subunit [Hyphomicrobium sp.]|jgi:membrane fusion protein (multidrug efflux system)
MAAKRNIVLHAEAKVIAIFLVLAPLVLAMAACGDTEKATKGAPEATAPAVLVEPAEKRTLARQIEFIGRVEAMEKVDLRARVKGFLGARLFADGDHVKQGQVVFTIEREPFETAVAQKNAQLASAKADYAFAKQQLDRATQLMRENSSAISQATLDQRISDEQRRKAGILEAEAAVREAEINLSYTEIKSPIDGRIGRAAVSPGNLVSPETGVLASIVAEDRVQVLFPVTQRELLDYRRRATADRKISVRVKLADGSLYDETGQVDFLDVKADPRTDGQIVRAMMPNTGNMLTDGQTIRVVIPEETEEKFVTVPQAAIAIDQGGPYVFVVSSNNVVEQRRIKTGVARDRYVAVTEGLNAGDAVVVEGLQKVRPGVTVAPQLAANPAPAAAGATP